MTIRISLRVTAFVIYTLALLGGAFGISYAVFEWRDDDDELDVATEVTTDEVEKFFSMTLETDEDFKEAARRIGALMPEFDCAGEFDEKPAPRGTLACDAGLSEFSCSFRPDSTTVGGSLVCIDGAQLTGRFPFCLVVAQGPSAGHLIRCSDPDGADVVCEAHVDKGLSLTCQRA